ncbi:DUF1190 domain-containing protein [Vibrio navarrensis]|uniref:DUF1190 domain-containing protein n=1 Tax=Vibrio navarrensis TaxID=29495 RepID=UPI00186A6BC7|nr:DUF1190 domain-containing protein [Vibrio navarrensis]MBE4617282.1 hypothetical protein [Vibrio navarrensis]
MKRSANVKKSSFDKVLPAIPYLLVGGVAAYSFYEPKTEGYIYRDSEQCKRNHPGYFEQCELAYKEALARAEFSAPRYQSESECKREFGYDSDDCYYSSTYHSYMPRMSSFFYTRDTSGLTSRSSAFFSQPLYRYRSGYYSGDGVSYGTKLGQAMKINTSSIKSSGGTIGKVMSRGGFGKSVSISRGG